MRQVRALYIAFAKGLFTAAPVGAYHWSEDGSTEIVISHEHPINATNIGQRPAVSFTRGPVNFYSLGMDDMLRYNFATGKKTKSVLVPGVMSLNCCSRNDLESEHIAWIMAEHLWLLRERLMGLNGFFEVGRQPQIGAPSPAGTIVANAGDDEWYCTTVTSPFQFPRTSQFTPLNVEVLNNIQLQMSLDAQQVQQKSYSYTGHESPVNVRDCPPPSFVPGASDTRGRSPDPAGTAPAPPPHVEPHPLRPGVQVVVRNVYPNRTGARSLSIGGRAIPIADTCPLESEEKSPFPGVTTKI